MKENGRVEGTVLEMGVNPCLPRRATSEFSQEVASQTFASWNQLTSWLRRIDELRRAA